MLHNLQLSNIFCLAGSISLSIDISYTYIFPKESITWISETLWFIYPSKSLVISIFVSSLILSGYTIFFVGPPYILILIPVGMSSLKSYNFKFF